MKDLKINNSDPLFCLFFTLVSFFVNGCEDSAVNNIPTGEAQNQIMEENNKQADSKKQPAKQNLDKSSVKKQPVKVSPKHDDKPPHAGTVDNPEITERVQDKRVLDLTVPLNKMPETKYSDNESSNEKRNYLPDLFTDQKDKKNNSMQVNGKMIRREEEEVGKHKAVDGAEINIKLTH